MKLRCVGLVGEKLITSAGVAEFDKEGVATVTEEVAKIVLEVRKDASVIEETKAPEQTVVKKPKAKGGVV